MDTKFRNYLLKDSNQVVSFSAIDDEFLPQMQHKGDAGADLKLYLDDDSFLKPSYIKQFLTDARLHGAKIFRDGVDISRGENTSGCCGVFLKPNKTVIVRTGLKIQLPKPANGLVYLFKIYGRSGYGFKHGITLTNSVGIVDSNFEGEIMVSLINHGSNYHLLTRGSRIAQGIIERVIYQEWFLDYTKDDSLREANGFGSSGS